MEVDTVPPGKTEGVSTPRREAVMGTGTQKDEQQRWLSLFRPWGIRSGIQ